MDQSLIVNAPWTLTQKAAFRFFFIFFPLFILFNPNVLTPEWMYDYYIQPLYWLMGWAAKHLLHFTDPLPALDSGSGDTTYDYLVLLFVTIVAAVSALMWSVTERKPVNYNRLYYWLIVMLRLYVGFNMISYGLVKVIKLQFPSPTNGRLMEAYGDSSPMGLAWTFMGFSRGYNYFTGIAEILCGVLLLFRKTTLLGAVIALTVIANIVAVNYCFDVPVKIVSSMLLLMVIVILLKDLNRILQFFFLNQAAEPANLSPYRFKKRWKNVALITLKYVFIGLELWIAGHDIATNLYTYGDNAPKPLIYGLFNTTSFVLNKDTLPPLTTDTLRWRKLNFTKYGGLQVILMDDRKKIYMVKTDAKEKTVTLKSYQDSTQAYTLKYKLNNDSTLQLTGKAPAGNINASFKRFDERNYLLMKRGFHWVNNVPFNR